MKLSIIIPAYNVENHILRGLDSLRKHLHNECEIIIVNDGSTDNTYEIVNRFINENRELNITCLDKENGGVSSARNIGIRKSTGEYIMFLDGDDYVDSILISQVTPLITHGDFDVICWGFNRVTEEGQCIDHYFNKYEKTSMDMSGLEAFNKIIVEKKLWIAIGSSIIRKSILTTHNISYCETCINGEDQEFTYKTLIEAKRVKFIKKVMTYYVDRKSSTTNTYNIRKLDVVAAFIRVIDHLKKHEIDKKDEMKLEKRLCEEALKGFYHNLEHCFISKIENNHDMNTVLKILYQEMNDIYDEIECQIKKLIKTHRYSSHQILIRNWLYIKDNYLYFILYNFYYKTKKLLYHFNF